MLLAGGFQVSLPCVPSLMLGFLTFFTQVFFVVAYIGSSCSEEG